MADPEKTGIKTEQRENGWQRNIRLSLFLRRHLPCSTKFTRSPNIEMPKSNPFIPQHLSLVESGREWEAIKPKLLCADTKSTVYYAHDTKYMVPQASFSFSIRSPLLNGSAKSSVLLDLYLKALNENLSSTLFFAAGSRAACVLLQPKPESRDVDTGLQ
jgi:secreted Zn-dependent insulinase-like peptidase